MIAVRGLKFPHRSLCAKRKPRLFMEGEGERERKREGKRVGELRGMANNSWDPRALLVFSTVQKLGLLEQPMVLLNPPQSSHYPVISSHGLPSAGQPCRGAALHLRLPRGNISSETTLPPTFIILLCVPPASVQPTWTPVNEPFQPSLPVHPTLHLVVPQAPCINLQRPQPVANVCSVHSTGFPHFAPYSSATALYVLLFCGMDDVEHCR